jgi:thiamine-monophosphate kinase
VKLELRLADLPLAAGLGAVADQPLEFAASAGDDYELLFTTPAESRAAAEEGVTATGSCVTWLGDVRAGGGLVELRAADGTVVELTGYEH